MNNRLQLDITCDCNLKCYKCDRFCSTASSKEMITLKQIKKFILEDKNNYWSVIEVIGGEPTTHPNFWKIVDLLYDHIKDTSCELKVDTNGFDIIKTYHLYKNLRNKVGIINSNKKSKEQEFNSITVAPIDIDSTFDFTKMCYRPKECGHALSRTGYYLCGAGAAIDRVVGFDIGIKSFTNVTDEALIEQAKIICPLCGHFLGENPTKENIICTRWKQILQNYRTNKPVLTLY